MKRLLILCLGVLTLGSTTAFGQIAVEIKPDIVYGHKDGLAMTFDVFQPKTDSNGTGVLFMVSGGWYSTWRPPEQMQIMFLPLTQRGFTVFAVRHGSSPKYGIVDAVSDVRRAVRTIRMRADEFGVDPNRLGVYGMSAGGHLSLMLGTGGDDGDPNAKDPVDKVSSRVQAVVAYVAPTDLTIAVRGAPERLPAYDRFPALDLDLAAAKTMSPLLLTTSDDAPTLLIAGVKDDLVPIAHSRRILEALKKAGVTVELIEYPDSGHGLVPQDAAKAMQATADWFEKHLAKSASSKSETK